ncbi:MAG: hypothetical protein BZ135_05670, partial [Methanosphaera sp. rholeuAM6]
MFTVKTFKRLFFQNNRKKYVYKNELVSDRYIINLIELIWDNNCSINEIGSNLASIIGNIKKEFVFQMNLNKESFLKYFHKINKHDLVDNKILEKLYKYNVQTKDRLIILDIYQFYLKHNFKFDFVTYDDSFCNSEDLTKLF